MGENARRASLRYDRRAAVQRYHELFAGLNRKASAA
jgi:hypothetical protein